jgi:protein-L-isoaspartate(D-aspartate) O-methyltransferase
VPREEFVPARYRNLAFSDLEIPLGEGERMWPPKVEARVLQDSPVQRTERVLEVGTGSGYFTALLAHRARQVYTVEIRARAGRTRPRQPSRHGRDNVTAEIGDGARGYPKWGPYDVVVLTGSIPLVPRALLDSLTRAGGCSRWSATPRRWPRESIRAWRQERFRSVDFFETVVAPLANCEQPPRFKF